jgi:hypothetical protein
MNGFMNNFWPTGALCQLAELVMQVKAGRGEFLTAISKFHAAERQLQLICMFTTPSARRG